MSKLIKRMQMEALAQTLGDTRDLVLLTMSGVNAIDENKIRLALRKKNIRLHHVKNSLAGRVLKEKGLSGLDNFLQGPTTLAWGAGGIAELSKELDTHIKKNKKIVPKAAVAEGSVVTFEDAKKLPTRLEAIAGVMASVLGPAATLVGQLTGPGATLASQLKTISEKKDEGAPAAAPTA
jgi:large subunit ribosomal protein L10